MVKMLLSIVGLWLVFAFAYGTYEFFVNEGGFSQSRDRANGSAAVAEVPPAPAPTPAKAKATAAPTADRSEGQERVPDAEIERVMDRLGQGPASAWRDLGFEWRLAISRYIARENGFVSYDMVNRFMLAIAQHPEFKARPMGLGFEAAVVRGRRDKW